MQKKTEIKEEKEALGHESDLITDSHAFMFFLAFIWIKMGPWVIKKSLD